MSEAPVEVAAHEQRTTLHLVYCFPAHEPRADDPHYALFNAARERLKRQGLLICQACGTDQGIELHHSACEFALANGVDVAKFAHRYPDLLTGTTDADFQAFVEGPKNLTPLCMQCHRGARGIHVLPQPVWELLGCEKSGEESFGHAEFGAGQTDVPDPDAPAVAATPAVPAITGGTAP